MPRLVLGFAFDHLYKFHLWMSGAHCCDVGSIHSAGHVVPILIDLDELSFCRRLPAREGFADLAGFVRPQTAAGLDVAVHEAMLRHFLGSAAVAATEPPGAQSATAQSSWQLGDNFEPREPIAD
jgi:hypothetical protein